VQVDDESEGVSGKGEKFVNQLLLLVREVGRNVRTTLYVYYMQSRTMRNTTTIALCIFELLSKRLRDNIVVEYAHQSTHLSVTPCEISVVFISIHPRESQ